MARYFFWMLLLVLLVSVLVSGCGGGDDGNQGQSLAVQLSATPQSGTTSNLFIFHAETANAADLLCRWDWEGDGTYDTSYHALNDAEYIFSAPGTYHPTVEVKDTLGNTVSDSVTVVVTQETNPIYVHVTATPEQGTTQTVFTFHTSALEDLAQQSTRDQLINFGYVRWDWEDDGIFDVPFTFFQIDVFPPENNIEPKATHRFTTPGTYHIRAQVKRFERIGADTVDVIVTP